MGGSEFDSDGTEVARPHIQKLNKQLEELTHENWDSWPVLREVLSELLFRRKKLAMQVRTEVVERLIELQLESFRFPSTEAPNGTKKLGSVDWPDTSLLKFMGYSVGQKGATEDARRAILDYVYKHPVPQVGSPEYMAKWGQPRTGTRLKQIAENIAASARNKKRSKFGDFSVAIDEWEDDLEYLRVTYYVDKYDFGWPNTDV